MKMEVQGLSLSLGYRDDWQPTVSEPTPDRMRLTRDSVRLAMRRQYGWLLGPPCDLAAYQQVQTNLTAAFNTGTGRLGNDLLLPAVRALIRCKQPANVEGEFDIEVDGAEQFGTCYPKPDPPPFGWNDRMSFNLIKPNGKRASITVTTDTGQDVKVKLIVGVSWEVPEFVTG